MIDMKLVLEQTKDINLLYVEDNQALRESTMMVLKNFFNNIDIAEDGLIGLNKYKEKLQNSTPYDLIISDINMPNLNGLEMSEEIIKLESRQSIIIVTAHNEVEFLHNAIKVGVESFLAKPLKLDDLAFVLFKVCQSINDKKFVSQYYDSMESRNIELTNEINSLKDQVKNLIKSGGKSKEDSSVKENIQSLTKEELTDLTEIKSDMETDIVMLDQYIDNEDKTKEYLTDLSNTLNKIVYIMEFYTFADNLSNNLRSLSMQIVANDLPSNENRKELYKKIASLIISLNTFINANKLDDKEKIAQSLENLNHSITALLSKWENEIETEEYA
jgi:YesN/AraC family two-component response regulator